MTSILDKLRAPTAADAVIQGVKGLGKVAKKVGSVLDVNDTVRSVVKGGTAVGNAMMEGQYQAGSILTKSAAAPAMAKQYGNTVAALIQEADQIRKLLTKLPAGSPDRAQLEQRLNDAQAKIQEFSGSEYIPTNKEGVGAAAMTGLTLASGMMQPAAGMGAVSRALTFSGPVGAAYGGSYAAMQNQSAGGIAKSAALGYGIGAGADLALTGASKGISKGVNYLKTKFGNQPIDPNLVADDAVQHFQRVKEMGVTDEMGSDPLLRIKMELNRKELAGTLTPDDVAQIESMRGVSTRPIGPEGADFSKSAARWGQGLDLDGKYSPDDVIDTFINGNISKAKEAVGGSWGKYNDVLNKMQERGVGDDVIEKFGRIVGNYDDMARSGGLGNALDDARGSIPDDGIQPGDVGADFSKATSSTADDQIQVRYVSRIQSLGKDGKISPLNASEQVKSFKTRAGFEAWYKTVGDQADIKYVSGMYGTGDDAANELAKQLRAYGYNKDLVRMGPGQLKINRGMDGAIISLDQASDTYTVQYYKTDKSTLAPKFSRPIEGVYFDQLGDVVENVKTQKLPPGESWVTDGKLGSSGGTNMKREELAKWRKSQGIVDDLGDDASKVGAGDVIEWTNKQGQTVRGKVVMNGPAGPVVNIGGASGTPKVAPQDYTVVRRSADSSAKRVGQGIDDFMNGDGADFSKGNKGNTTTGAQRANNRMDKIFSNAKKLEQERLIRGEMPNPSLTSPEEAAKYGWNIKGREVTKLPSAQKTTLKSEVAKTQEWFKMSDSLKQIQQNIDDMEGIAKGFGANPNIKMAIAEQKKLLLQMQDEYSSKFGAGSPKVPAPRK